MVRTALVFAGYEKTWPDLVTGKHGVSSPNYFTWGYTHDWCVTDGLLRISGEDHFSALKPPRTLQRCQNMLDWLWQRYPELPRASVSGRECYHGVYSETPDHLPLMGAVKKNDNVYYLVGCNAWGQASLSLCASLVPGLLGYRKWTPQQRHFWEFVSIARFSIPLPSQSSEAPTSRL